MGIPLQIAYLQVAWLAKDEKCFTIPQKLDGYCMRASIRSHSGEPYDGLFTQALFDMSIVGLRLIFHRLLPFKIDILKKRLKDSLPPSLLHYGNGKAIGIIIIHSQGE